MKYESSGGYQVIDIRELIETVNRIVQNHHLGTPGSYRRWGWGKNGKDRDLGTNAYGCADAANILYSVGSFPEKRVEREGFIASLRSFQDPSTGIFKDKGDRSHHELHTTAHCVAALELFDARPKHPIRAVSGLKSKSGLESFLDGLDWKQNPWIASHKGAGLFSAMVLCNEVSGPWQDWYFDWFWKEADPETGFWRKGCADISGAGLSAPLFHHMAGTFHYLFVHEYAHRPLRYPEKMIDACLALYRDRAHGIPIPLSDGSADRNPTVSILGREIGFSEIDWVYCMNRSRRQSCHRFEETDRILKEFAGDYLKYLMEAVDTEHNDRFNDLHWLFGTVCALAELQQALPGFIKTDKPLKLVLDRRPFI
jgi:hypothetical protein